MAVSLGQHTANTPGFWLNPFHIPQIPVGKDDNAPPDCGSVTKNAGIPMPSPSENGKKQCATVTTSPLLQFSIIQCPNPTSNPLEDHQKQKEVQDSQMKRMEDADYMESMERNYIEALREIEALKAQNHLLSVQLRQHQDYISMVQGQNNVLLTACSVLQPNTVPTVVLPATRTVGQQCAATWNPLMENAITGIEGQSDL